jgi:hypothetical protein
LILSYWLVLCFGLSIFGVRSPKGDWSRRWNGSCEAFRAFVTELAVRPMMVVLAAVVLDDHSGFGQSPKLLAVEALVPEASMEALDEAVLPGAARLDVDRLDRVGRQPALDLLGDKLRTVVAAQVGRSSVFRDGPFHPFKHVSAFKRPVGAAHGIRECIRPGSSACAGLLLAWCHPR